MVLLQQIKGPADVTALGAGILSFFKAIPWPEIAAFLSAVYLLVRLFFIIKNGGKE